MEEKESKPKEIKYEKALAELEQILKAMQGDQCDIDQLAAMTRRATELLALCRNRLTATEAELRQILSSLDQS
ncbi:MAG: exodeoxyribonuclease VII small subunit [Bacteroidales bacterium]|nr:exodeoxyribonuclease VII small subunit [Bacteroidales bacterium]MCD8387808.1 exodeoxyribonuclease VII small subunit [Bacteroidales bacterium]